MDDLNRPHSVVIFLIVVFPVSKSTSQDREPPVFQKNYTLFFTLQFSKAPDKTDC